MPIETVKNLRKGDVVLVPATVKYNPRGDTSVTVELPNGYSTTSLEASEIEKVALQHLEEGDRVMAHADGEMVGTVKAVIDGWVVVWPDQSLSNPPRPWMLEIKDVERIEPPDVAQAA